MTAQRLLAIAELLCGPEARRRVFEPLVADWQQEWTEARSLTRTRPRAAVSGAAAFCWSLLRYVDPLGLVSRRPGAGFAVILLAFALAGALFAMQPLQYTWIGAGIRFIWLTPPEGIAYFLPKFIAIMAGFALLPAILLATKAGWGRLRLVAVVTVTLAAMVLVEGWVAPAAMRARDVRAGGQFQGSWSAREVRLYANTAEVVALAYGSDQQLAAAARQDLRNKSQVTVMSLSFALFGLALGRIRSRPFRNPGMLVLTACWFVGWATHQVLGLLGAVPGRGGATRCVDAVDRAGTVCVGCLHRDSGNPHSRS